MTVHPLGRQKWPGHCEDAPTKVERIILTKASMYISRDFSKFRLIFNGAWRCLDSEIISYHIIPATILIAFKIKERTLFIK